MNSRRAFLAGSAAALCFGRSALAQDDRFPADPSTLGPNGEAVVRRPEWRGRPFRAPVAPRDHLRNTDGSAPGPWDGLCVPTSVASVLRHHGRPDLAEALLRRAKALPGGYTPDQLERLLVWLRENHEPRLKWFQYVGQPSEGLSVAEKWNKKGYALGGTMAISGDYRGPVSHMVTWDDINGLTAAFHDNNFPGRFRVMDRKKADRSHGHYGTAWIVGILTPPPPRPPARRSTLRTVAAIAIPAAGLAICTSIFGATAALVHRIRG